MNTMKTTMLMAALTVLFVLVGKALGGQGGMVLAFALPVCGRHGGNATFGGQRMGPIFGSKIDQLRKAISQRCHFNP